MDTLKRTLKISVSFIGMLILLILPYGLVILGQWIVEKIKQLPSINETLKMNENVIVILNNGTQTKKYDSKRRIMQWRKA